MKKLLFLDTETTGTEERDRLIQVAYEIEGRQENKLFKPLVPIDLVAMSVHHITEKMVNGKAPFIDSPTYHDLKTLSEDEDVVLVAHNAKFDLGQLAKEGIVFPTYICTYKCAYWLQDERMANHQQQYLRYYYGLEVDTGDLAAHDALADILVLKEVFEAIYAHVAHKSLTDEPMELSDMNGFILDKMIDISTKPLLFNKFMFGKHDFRKTGMTIEDIVTKLPYKDGKGYLQWLLEQKLANPAGEEDWIYTLNYWLSK